jgi:hypothetical protein
VVVPLKMMPLPVPVEQLHVPAGHVLKSAQETRSGPFRARRTLNREQVRLLRGIPLLFDRIKTVSKAHLNDPLGLSVERRADSPGYWKD